VPNSKTCTALSWDDSGFGKSQWDYVGEIFRDKGLSYLDGNGHTLRATEDNATLIGIFGADYFLNDMMCMYTVGDKCSPAFQLKDGSFVVSNATGASFTFLSQFDPSTASNWGLFKREASGALIGPDGQKATRLATVAEVDNMDCSSAGVDMIKVIGITAAIVFGAVLVGACVTQLVRRNRQQARDAEMGQQLRGN